MCGLRLIIMEQEAARECRRREINGFDDSLGYAFRSDTKQTINIDRPPHWTFCIMLYKPFCRPALNVDRRVLHFRSGRTFLYQSNQFVLTKMSAA